MMKFLSVLILASLAGAFVCGEENLSDALPPELIDNAANTEAPEEIISKSVTVPAEASSGIIQTTLAAEKSAENQEGTTQKADPSATRLSILKSAATFMKNKIEEFEEKAKNKVNAVKELKNLPRKYVKTYLV